VRIITPASWLIASTLLGCAASTQAQATGQTASSPSPLPAVQERVEVTATRLPEAPDEVPAAIEVFLGEELRARGARDLRGALALAIGVDVAPGGDAGPASAVPELWGLKEFDAFLLVVDGVPWGGAFNPALTALTLTDIKRIEVLRGPAPVVYGATSFVGVIQVIRNGAGAPDRSLSLRGGSFQSGGGTFTSPVPFVDGWSSRLTVDAEREGFRDERTAFRRGHVLWRAEHAGSAEARQWFTVDVNWLDQDPASPRPRVGASLSPLVAVDTNHNPAGAFLNDRRATLFGGFDRAVAGASWSTTGSFSMASQDIFRGFLQDVADVPSNAHGLREQIDLTDIYVDSHFLWKPPGRLLFIVGADYLHGEGHAVGADFDYTVPLAGTPVSVPEPETLDIGIEDRRDFAGAYASAEWRVTPRVRIDAGVRLNITNEEREGGDEAGGEAERAGEGENRQTNVRPSGSAGVTWTVWQRESDALRLFATYRDTFKPAAFDFGLGEGEAEEEGLLKPETSRSYEGGLKARWFGGRVGAEASAFLMDFENLVIATTVNGLPALTNAGTERFRGVETGTSVSLRSDVLLRATYSFHDATFQNFVQQFDGVPTQLGGKRLEMSARHLAAAGIVYTPAHGWFGSGEVNFVGSRFLNKRNTALADGFATIGAGAGFRTAVWEVRLDVRNLTNRRDPVAESELGDAQYYVMPARRVDLGLTVRF
jgi:iron complex outermembrane receptor protein